MRLLIVRLGALGDIIHAIPVAAALRRAYPDARIDWLISAKHQAILACVPVVDERIVVNDRGQGDEGRSALGALRELRRRRYDVAIDLQGLIKSALFARGSGAARVVGFSGRHARESMAAWFYSHHYDPAGGGVRAGGDAVHVVRLNLGMLTALGLTPGEPEFPIVPPDSAVARQVASSTEGRYALINPGAAWPNKRWPPTRFAAVARHLRARHDLPSVVVWGPGERDLADAIVAGGEGAARLSPPTTIGDLVSLASGAAIVVSGDTGPMHIAAAVHAPIVGLFGPTRAARNGPWRAYDEVVSRWETCECHHLRRCRREIMCISEIDVEDVTGAIDRRLAAGRAHG